MSDTIVVGLTDTPVAERLVAWATRRAIDRRQSLRLVSVVDGRTDLAGEQAAADEFLQTTRDRIEQEVTRLRGGDGGDTGGGVDVEVVITHGSPLENLIEAAEGAALLAIGSDYRGPDSPAVRGVRGVRIASAASCPVVTVPDFDTGGGSGVVIGVDGSSASENALAWATAEADRLKEPLVAVSAWVPIPHPRHMRAYPPEYLTNMQRNTEEMLALALDGLRSQYPAMAIETRVDQAHPSSAIHEAAAGARMAVVGTHGRGAVRRFLLGSVSHEVLNRLATITAVVR